MRHSFIRSELRIGRQRLEIEQGPAPNADSPLAELRFRVANGDVTAGTLFWRDAQAGSLPIPLDTGYEAGGGDSCCGGTDFFAWNPRGVLGVPVSEPPRWPLLAAALGFPEVLHRLKKAVCVPQQIKRGGRLRSVEANTYQPTQSCRRNRASDGSRRRDTSAKKVMVTLGVTLGRDV